MGGGYDQFGEWYAENVSGDTDDGGVYFGFSFILQKKLIYILIIKTIHHKN
ncbi:MAG: hypothetical protein KA313_04045 [Pseudarcicella sp.]|nr:hypothetical protein [Pseudarcicella sp.]